jgi:hypothetical protein
MWPSWEPEENDASQVQEHVVGTLKRFMVKSSDMQIVVEMWLLLRKMIVDLVALMGCG